MAPCVAVGFIASLKVMTTLVSGKAPVAPGETAPATVVAEPVVATVAEAKVGFVVSGAPAVVKEAVNGAPASGLPARSLTPLPSVTSQVTLYPKVADGLPSSTRSHFASLSSLKKVQTQAGWEPALA